MDLGTKRTIPDPAAKDQAVKASDTKDQENGSGSPLPTGLPTQIRACLFGMDGVLIATADLHFAAWRSVFDEYMRRLPAVLGVKAHEFRRTDYEQTVNGKAREAGIRDYLTARGLAVQTSAGRGPVTAASVTPEKVAEIGRRKDEVLRQLLVDVGVHSVGGAKAYLDRIRSLGLLSGVVTSSVNGRRILELARMSHFADVVVDGNDIRSAKLGAKPAPDIYLATASALQVPPADAAIFEDSLAGVRAARNGGFGYIVALDRTGQAGALRAAGANVVISDLADLM